MFTWATHATPASTHPLRSAICVAAGEFVACGAGGKILTSSDSGVTWTSRTAASANDWTGLAFDGVTVVAVAQAGASIRVMRSTDKGHTWTAATTVPEANTWNAVCSPALGTFVAVSGSGAHRAMISTDSGATWATRNLTTGSWVGVAANGATLVAWSGSTGATAIAVSTNTGTAWATSAAPGLQSNLTYAGGVSVVGYSTALAKFVLNGQDSTTFEAKTYTATAGTGWASPGAATGKNGFYGFVIADSIAGFIGSLPIDSGFSAASPSVIGWSVDEGVTWTADDTTFSGDWSVAAWDPSTGTVVFFDASSDVALVGTYTTAPPPADPVSLDTVYPDSGAASGGDTVTLRGHGFVSGIVPTFDGQPATNVVIVSPLTLTCTPPAHAIGSVDVAISGYGTLTNGYRYVARASDANRINAGSAPNLPPVPAQQPPIDARTSRIDPSWLRWFNIVKQRIEASVGVDASAVISGLFAVAQIPTLPWSKVTKDGSSLADLTTRSASDLSSGTVAQRFGGTGRANAYNTAPSSFTVASGTFSIHLSRLQLNTTERVTVQGTGRVGVL